MRLLFLGDILGKSGRQAVVRQLPDLRKNWKLDGVVINGENAAGGFGITQSICDELIDAGADAITLGNHSFDQREALVFIARQPRLVRPANYPNATPGRGAALVDLQNGARLLVINIMGRLFMDAMDDPFAALNRELDMAPLRQVSDAVIVDIHAEATSEKQAVGYFCDGRASLVVGTHTHVPSADARILPLGTAYQSDAGMCGDYESIIGFKMDEPLRRMVEKTPGSRWEAAEGAGTICGAAVQTDDSTGLALHIAPVRLGPVLREAVPDFWA
jgi:2',3'-cyclic-nucleotide 2'-phosphodiesterase